MLQSHAQSQTPRIAAIAAAVSLGLAACGGGSEAVDAPVAVPCPIGDLSQPVEMEVVHLDESFAIQPTLEGARVPLSPPPQGGWILLLGVRARNIDGCRLTLSTSFREACDGPLIKLDRRPARLTDTGDGWGMQAISTFGNLPLCPQLTAQRDLYEQPYDITVEIEDADGKRASKTMSLTPYCPDDALCRCECDHNYVLGGGCPPVGPDAGIPSCLQ